MTVYKQNLQALYDEVMPRYELLTSKINEVNERAKEVYYEMEKAKESYDVERLTALTIEATSLKEVSDQLQTDKKKYLDSLQSDDVDVRKHKQTINKRINEAYKKDFGKENKSQDIQEMISKSLALQEELKELKKRIAARYHETAKAYQEEISKFNKVANYNSPTMPGGSDMLGFWLVKDDEK